MIQDPQEYLDKWEREHNPFYPSEMRWDRVKVNRFLKDWKEQCNIANVVGQSEQLKAFLLFIQENAPNYRTKQLKPDQVIKAYLESL